MYPAITGNYHQNKLLAGGLRLWEILQLKMLRRRKKVLQNESLDYFMDHIEKGSVMIDIGTHQFDYIHQVRRLARKIDKLVLFEAAPDSRRYFLQKKESLQMENVEIEDIHLYTGNENVFAGKQLYKAAGARVIDFTQRMYRTVKQVSSETLDNYCQENNLQPGYLRINAEGQEMQILEGAAALLTHRPKLLITCEERFAGREKIWETFSLLHDLGYHGYFILGDARIPVANFDFNIYQNPVYDFYCKDFIFE